MRHTTRGSKDPTTDGTDSEDSGLPFDAWPEYEERDHHDFESPDGVQMFIQEAVRHDLAPTVDDLVAAPVHDDVDGGEAVAEYLLRATETGECATDALRGIDAYSLPEKQDQALKQARDLLWSTAAWVATGKPRHLDEMAHDLEEAADAVQAAVDEPVNVPTPDSDGGHPADDRWTKHTESARAELSSPVVNFSIDNDWDGEEARGSIELLDLTCGDQVSIAMNVEGKTDGTDVEVGATHDLSVAQAEQLADALAEYAADAREERERNE